MSVKQVFLAAALAMVLAVATPRSHAQVISGGYVGFGTPGFGGVVAGAPVLAPAPFVTPVVPYATPYSGVVVGSPFYRGWNSGWGYGPRYYGPRYYGPRYYNRGYGFGRRRWW